MNKKFLSIFSVIFIGCFLAFGAGIPGVGDSFFAHLIQDTVSGNTVTIDFNQSLNHYIVLGNGSNTVTLIGQQGMKKCTLVVKQPSSGVQGTITFSPTPIWAGGASVSTTATNNSIDIFNLIYDSVNSKWLADAGNDYK